jgi:peptide/nickel transport system permease protein
VLNYLIRRLLLLPVTLFCIVLVNFVIINLAPGDPTTATEISPEGNATRKEDRSVAFGSDDRYLQFREFYGLTLPILFNTWPWLTLETTHEELWQLVHHKESPASAHDLPLKEYDSLRIQTGDQARFMMPNLLHILLDPSEEASIRRMASRFFVRGGTRQAILGPNLTAEQEAYNKKISKDNLFLASQKLLPEDSPQATEKKVFALSEWYAANQRTYVFEPDLGQTIAIFFTETRFWKYLSRVATLDFGTLRNDANKTVIYEVVRRFKYSLTLAIIPLLITFVLCQVFGFLMAYKQNTMIDHGLNFIFLILYAIPVFVVAPFLIEIAINRDFPFTDIPIPYSGFSSPDRIYAKETSAQRLLDILTHIFLPLIAVSYGSLAAQARLSRTAVLEVLRQDYIRTAKAKGVPPFQILWKHVGRNAGITIITSVAGSLGIVLGGSLIVETLFDINGFGKFFYDAVLNRDYNVIMFSTLAGSFLTLAGFLVADIAYTLLDPRVTLE